MAKRRPWTEDEVVEVIRCWAADHGGVPPAATDFHPGDCRRSARLSAARSASWMSRASYAEARDFPWPRTVQRLFGSWNAAVEAAGLVPRRTSIGTGELTRGPTFSRVRATLDQAEGAEGDERRRLLYRVAEMALAAAE